MEHIEKSIEVELPVNPVYNQWTQFEEFPQFMEGVEEVQQLDDSHLHWKARVGGALREWDAEILEQVPDRTIAWHNTTGAINSGRVNFLPKGNNRTEVTLSLNYEPQGAMENLADALGIISRRVEGDLKRFKEFIETRRTETGAWRGEVHGGHATKPATAGTIAPGATGAGTTGTAGTTRTPQPGNPGPGAPGTSGSKVV